MSDLLLSKDFKTRDGTKGRIEASLYEHSLETLMFGEELVSWGETLVGRPFSDEFDFISHTDKPSVDELGDVILIRIDQYNAHEFRITRVLNYVDANAYLKTSRNPDRVILELNDVIRGSVYSIRVFEFGKRRICNLGHSHLDEGNLETATGVVLEEGSCFITYAIHNMDLSPDTKRALRELLCDTV